MITFLILMAVNCNLNDIDIATCNFYFSDYVSTLLLQTMIVKCDYVQKQVQKLSLLLSHTINIFSPITSDYLMFSIQH